MKNNPSNYFTMIKLLDGVDKLPGSLRSGHALMMKIGAANMNKALEKDVIREKVEAFMDKFTTHYNTVMSQSKKAEKKPVPKPKVPPTPKPKSRPAPKAPRQEKKPDKQGIQHEYLTDELKLLNRIKKMEGKSRSMGQLLRLHQDIQKAILEKRVRKNSPNAKLFERATNIVVSICEKAVSSKSTHVVVKFTDKDFSAKLNEVVQSNSIWPGVELERKFINMQGKEVPVNKASTLARGIEKSYSSEKVSIKDPTFHSLKKTLTVLKSYINSGKKSVAFQNNQLNGLYKGKMPFEEYILQEFLKMNGKIISKNELMKVIDAIDEYREKRKIPPAMEVELQIVHIFQTLLGIAKELHKQNADAGLLFFTENQLKEIRKARESLLNGFDTQKPINSLETVSRPVSNARLPETASEVAKKRFKTIPLQAPWDFLGKVPYGATFLVYGEPGAGKSTALIKFGKYFAENHGRVLYVSHEEDDSATLTDRVNNFGLTENPDYQFHHTYQGLPIEEYDLVILDSVTSLHLSLEEFEAMRKRYTKTIFMLVLQVTKENKFRGSMKWPHDLNAVLVAKDGKLFHTKNRYGGIGEIDIF